jgi:hypothetical protein
MTPLDEEYLIVVVPQLEAEIAELRKRMGMLEAELRDRGAIDARRSSIEVGTPAKGGNLHYYFNPFAPQSVNDIGLQEVKRIFENAGGKIQ